MRTLSLLLLKVVATVVVGLLAAILIPNAQKAWAADPTSVVTQGSVTVTVTFHPVAPATNTDATNVKADFDQVVASSTFKTDVITGGSLYGNAITVNVYKGAAGVYIGEQQGNVVRIDLSDIVAMLAYMEAVNPNDETYVQNWMRRDVLTHEIVHIAGFLDPDPGLAGNGGVVAEINKILHEQLGADYTRQYYAYCNASNRSVIHFLKGSADVIFNMTGHGGFPPCDQSCNTANPWGNPLTSCSSAAVGGIAEWPEIDETQPTVSEPSTTNYALWAGIAAGATATVVVVIGAAWYARRRWLS